MEKRKRGLKMFLGSILTIVLGFMAIAVVVFFLGTYLFKIQVPERLRYVKDYSDFVLEISPVSNCSNQVISLFQYEDVIYNGICIDQVFIKYGTTKAPLEFVLNEKYIGLKDLTKKFQKIDVTDQGVAHYEYRRSEEENGNYFVTILSKDYQNVKMQEVTFEIYQERELEKTEENIPVDVSGVATIN